MSISVSVANPGSISGVSVAHPTGGVSISKANPGAITSVGNAAPYYQTGGINGSTAGTFSLTPPAAAPATPAANPAIAANDAAIRALAAQIKSMQEATAPTPNFDAINANANARAATDVNPVYTKYLNDFLGQQAQQQATQTAIRDTNIQQAQDVLKNTQEANTVTGNRTTQDTATKEANAAQATDWRQTDQGGQYDIDRVAQAIQQAKSGTAGSGIAAGQQASSQQAFNTKESRQATQDQQQLQATELAKARTFEDLATSNKLATQKEGGEEKNINFNLSTFIQQQGMDLQNKQQQLELQRQGALAAQTQKYVKSGFQSFFNTISNPAQKAAFAKAYGSYLA